MTIDYSRKDSQQRRPRRRQDAAARARALAARVPAVVGRHGPGGHDSADDVYLRTAVCVDPDGWAHFDYVKMPDYRWGIFLDPAEADRKVNFGAHKGEPAWQEVPGEYRANLRRLIVTQGDTEPASVEQQRLLGLTCPSLYDLRNLFQVNVEEGRHLWAMVYLLHAYFGRDGREEAEELLERRSGDADNPRILGAFNEPTPDWLSFFMFTYFTDRDGKYQLAALAERGFDPLARTAASCSPKRRTTCSSGETGVGRILQRTAEAMAQHKTEDPAALRAMGLIDLATIQRYLNFHFSVTMDLFGADARRMPRPSTRPGSKAASRRPSGTTTTCCRRHLHRARDTRRPDRQRRGAHAQRPEREAARRLHQRCRGRRGALEPHHRQGRRVVRAQGAAQGVPPPHRAARRGARRPGGQRRHDRGVAGERRSVAAERRRPGVRRGR